MMFRNRALPLGALTILVLAVSGCGESPSGPAPDLVLITIDTLRADHCSCYGYFRATTPNLDRLAQKGARFETAYSPMPTTGPAHASIFTALYPMAHGVVKNGYVLDPEFRTLAELLKSRGYATAAFVSSFAVNSRFGYDQGFDLYDEDFSGQRSSFPAGSWEGISLESGNFDRPADATTERAMKWVEEHAGKDKPFFLWVHYFDPHRPFTPPKSYSRFFNEGKPPADRRDHKKLLYDREVRFADHEMGRLLECIERDARSTPTLIIATSDHGEGLMDHGYKGHGLFVYEEAVRLPLVLSMPGRIRPGSVYRAPVEAGDLMPTAFALLDLTFEKGQIHGRDLSGCLLQDEEPAPNRPVFTQRRHFESRTYLGHNVEGDKYCVRQGDWKYILSENDGVEELYNLKDDPKELENLTARDTDRKEALADRLRQIVTSLKRISRVRRQEISNEDNEILEALGYTR